MESILANLSYTARYKKALQVRAAIKSPGANLLYPLRERDLCQAAAAIKCPITKFCNTIRHYNTRYIAAIVECTLANFLDRHTVVFGRNLHFCCRPRISRNNIIRPVDGTNELQPFRCDGLLLAAHGADAVDIVMMSSCRD